MMPAEWGTITPSGWLTLPKELGEFVIVHELVHLLAPSSPRHGKVFKLFLHAFMPDWEERERELRGYTAV